MPGPGSPGAALLRQCFPSRRLLESSRLPPSPVPSNVFATGRQHIPAYAFKLMSPACVTGAAAPGQRRFAMLSASESKGTESEAKCV